jgi:hypothetical protein
LLVAFKLWSAVNAEALVMMLAMVTQPIFYTCFFTHTGLTGMTVRHHANDR